MIPRAKQHIGAAIISLVVLRALVDLSGEYLFLWYVMVRDVVYLRAALLPATALLLSSAVIVIVALVVANGRVAPTALSTLRCILYVCGSAFVFGAVFYLAESMVRVGTLLRGQVWLGAAFAGLTVGVWAGVSVFMWILSLHLVSRVARYFARARA